MLEALPRSRAALIFVRLKDEMAVVIFPRYKECAIQIATVWSCFFYLG
jgi:hypothetical protein